MSYSNSDQRDFWSSPSGQQWLDHQQALDTALQPALEAVLHAACIQQGEAVLDIGCGTGASALIAAALAGPNGRVLGADISDIMVGRATQRAQEAGAKNAEFMIVDAQQDALPGPFDVLISRFGMMFFADPLAAFANLKRAIRPGGRMAFICWGAMPQNPWFGLTFKAATARLGPVDRSDPNAPGPTAFKDADRVTSLMADAGLLDAAAQWVDVELPLPEDAAGFLMQFGPAKRIIAEKNGTAEDEAAIRSAVQDALKPYTKQGKTHLPAGLWIYTARV